MDAVPERLRRAVSFPGAGGASSGAALDFPDDDARRSDMTGADMAGSGGGAIALLPAEEYRRERWPNGAGWTRQIASASEAGTGLLWRLSIAEITSAASYSLFHGLQRHQVLLQGDGIVLELDGAPAQRAEPPFGQVSFPGELPARCTLLGGPVHMFNLFHRPDRFDLSLWRRPVVGPMYFFPASGETWAMHLLSGQAELGGRGGGCTMQQGDSALLGAAGGCPGRVSLEGGGEVLVARLTPRAPAGADS